MTQQEVVDHAVRSVLLGDERRGTVLLASADRDSSDKVDELVKDLSKPTHADRSSDKWRLATLTVIADSAADDEEKLARLQLAYADFGYPEDMLACSIYEQVGVGPLEHMCKLIQDLREQLIHGTSIGSSSACNGRR